MKTEPRLTGREAVSSARRTPSTTAGEAASAESAESGDGADGGMARVCGVRGRCQTVQRMQLQVAYRGPMGRQSELIGPWRAGIRNPRHPFAQGFHLAAVSRQSPHKSRFSLAHVVLALPCQLGPRLARGTGGLANLSRASAGNSRCKGRFWGYGFCEL
jgi:hypothetical protein